MVVPAPTRLAVSIAARSVQTFPGPVDWQEEALRGFLGKSALEATV
jgi:hypothetical protein